MQWVFDSRSTQEWILPNHNTAEAANRKNMRRNGKQGMLLYHLPISIHGTNPSIALLFHQQLTLNGFTLKSPLPNDTAVYKELAEIPETCTEILDAVTGVISCTFCQCTISADMLNRTLHYRELHRHENDWTCPFATM